MLAFVLALCAGSPPAPALPLPAYAGRYGRTSSDAVLVEVRAGRLAMKPLLWRGFQALRPTSAADVFVLEERPEIEISFERAGDAVTGARVPPIGGDVWLPRLDPTRRLPAERLFAGEGRPAARALDREEPADAVRVARSFLQRFPSRASTSVACLRELSRLRPGDADVAAALGDALVAAGRRAGAPAAYRLALERDASQPAALAGLRRLGIPIPAVTAPSGWKVPFDLRRLFAPPTKREIEEVRRDWATRDLEPGPLETVASVERPWGAGRATLRLVAHRVRGSRHYAVVAVPLGAGPRSLPILLEAKGVSWDYAPLDAEKLTAPLLLRDDVSRVIVAAPGFRGETVRFDGAEYRSEGDRTDSWDGATDDLLALLTAVSRDVPEADPERVVAFGRSRGGSVALLAAERDPRIRRVAAWAAPTDWFQAMGTRGWSTREEVEEGLRGRAVPPAEGGQFIERYLLKAICGERDLSSVRRSMLAGSPLWFADRLPPTLALFGREDEMVPARNGTALREKAARARSVDVLVLDGAGHDLDDRARDMTRRFLTP